MLVSVLCNNPEPTHSCGSWVSVLNGPKLHFCFFKDFFLQTQVALPPLTWLLTETGHFRLSAVLPWS